MTTTTTSASLWETLEHTPSLEAKGVLAVLDRNPGGSRGAGPVRRILGVRFRRLVHSHPARRRGVAGPPEAHHRRGASSRRLLQREARRFFEIHALLHCAWLVLFGSKFVILEALVFAFGDRLKFSGPFHGIVALIVVVVVMLVVEAVLVKLYRRLG